MTRELADREAGSSHPDEALRLAACTLNIGAPIGKNKIRIVDGKIENLWLQGEESANRLDNIRLLATLLNYVQKFCAGHEVPHLSSIQKADHPSWLRDFFEIAGFDRCECLKPEAGGQRYRACLKLDSTQESSVITRDKGDEAPNQNSLHTANGGATKGTRSLLTNGVNGTQNPSASGATTTMSEDQALEWLAQNKTILSPGAITKFPNHADPRTKSDPAKHVTMTSTKEGDLPTKTPNQAGEKRKRDDSVHDGDARAPAQNPRSREKHEEKRDEVRIKQSLTDKSQQSSTISESKSSRAPAAKYSFTLASQGKDAAKSKEAPPAASTNLTDALLAQCDKTVPKTSPKQVKKETPVASFPRPPLSEPSGRLGYNLPSKSLTCYYWATQGACKHRNEDCIYAHYDTGNVARPPGAYKKSKTFHPSMYDDGTAWSDVNGINIKGLHDNSDGSNGFAPTGPRLGYDSWRPS